MVLENTSSNYDLEMLSGETILLFGGGRWARILLQVTMKILPNNKIVVISPRNANGMRNWVSANQASSRIIVSENVNDWLDYNFFSAIVVNAVHDHSNAIQWCIKKNIPVLVEKPISLNYEVVLDLHKQAIQHNVLMAPSHIFLFVSYLEEFKRKVVSAGSINKITIHWMDPLTEARYGEQKSYDAAVPIFADWLPHLLSIVAALQPEEKYSINSISTMRGGAKMHIILSGKLIAYEFILTRNGFERKRSICATTVSGELVELDFSLEPGIIRTQNYSYSADENWDSKEKPSSILLTTFFSSVKSKTIDPKLRIDLALTSCQLIKEIYPEYLSYQSEWLSGKILQKAPFDDDMRYACKEIIAGIPHLRSNLSLEYLEEVIYGEKQESVVTFAIRERNIGGLFLNLCNSQGINYSIN